MGRQRTKKISAFILFLLFSNRSSHFFLLIFGMGDLLCTYTVYFTVQHSVSLVEFVLTNAVENLSMQKYKTKIFVMHVGGFQDRVQICTCKSVLDAIG